MLPWQYGRIRCLYGRKTSLQSYSKHRVVPQLVQPVVVVPELLDQHLPAVWIQKILKTEREKMLNTNSKREFNLKQNYVAL